MKLSKQKCVVAAREAKRRLENPLTEAEEVEKTSDDAERLRKIQRTADRNSERLRVMAERRNAAGAEGLAAEASRKSACRKTHLVTTDEKAEKARLEAERRSVARVELLVAKAIRKSGRLKTNPLTADQKVEKTIANATRYRQSRLAVEQKAENVRIETERRNAKIKQAVVARAIEDRHRHRYATRSATVADSVVANASVSNKVLNVQQESDPVISSPRTARASREV